MTEGEYAPGASIPNKSVCERGIIGPSPSERPQNAEAKAGDAAESIAEARRQSHGALQAGEARATSHTGSKGSDDDIRLCRYCRQGIHPDAKVCPHCRSHQRRFWQHFRIEQTGLLVAVVMVLISFSQLQEARLKRKEASEALATATAAKTDAQDALKKTVESERRTMQLESNIRQQALVLVSISYFQATTRREVGTDRSVKATEEMTKEINSLLLLLIPDSSQRAQWIQELYNRLPAK